MNKKLFKVYFSVGKDIVSLISDIVLLGMGIYFIWNDIQLALLCFIIIIGKEVTEIKIKLMERK